MSYLILIIGAILGMNIFKKSSKLQTPIESVAKTIVNTYWAYMVDMSVLFDVDVNLIGAFIAQESSGDPTARGSAREIGLMQVTPAAQADVFQWQKDTTEGDMWLSRGPTDPGFQIFVGTAYFKMLLEYWKADPHQENKAIQSYNAGMGNVGKNPHAGNTYLTSIRGWQKVFYSITTGDV